MLDGAMTVWFILAALSVLFVLWDSLTNGVTSWVQRMAWILVTAYTGVFGLFFYLMSCRRPFIGAHDEFTKPEWKQAVNSEMHCLAGDATGIIIAALILSLMNLANGLDIVAEYVAGFVCGLLIFQALMMVGMYQGKYLLAVRKTIFAETVSMNFVMAGMIPTMVILERYWSNSDQPGSGAFWFRMSLASAIGGLVAYPINYWLVSRHLKHGCMTLPGADGPAPGLGHTSPEISAHLHDMDRGGEPAPSQHDHGLKRGGHQHGGHDHAAMEMKSLPIGTATIWVIFSFAVLFAALAATACYVPISF
jgi:hypothetical protein